jgi:hypothetical protein
MALSGRALRWTAAAALVVAIVGIAFVPTETKQGVDFVVSTYRLPLYAKALDFVHRDSSYARLAARIVGRHESAEARAQAVFDWTRANIHSQPAGLPVVDDHVWHIIVRGYGVDDQKSDVFTTLTMYAGVPAFLAGTADHLPRLVLSYAWIDGHWRVFDVDNGIVFRHGNGTLASAGDIERTPALAAELGGPRVVRSIPYGDYFKGYRAPVAPDLLRPELQMLFPRVTHRVRRLVGLGRREWQQVS